MKRDMEVVRQILLNVQDGDANTHIDGVDDETLKYHQELLVEKDLVKGNVIKNNETNTEIPAVVIIRKLSWGGHDFIDGIQDENRWLQVKAYLKKGGKIITIETIKLAIKELFM